VDNAAANDVVGVDRVASKLHDGQTVQVDGTAGVIRLLGE